MVNEIIDFLSYLPINKIELLIDDKTVRNSIRKETKQNVFKRDGCKCLICGSTDNLTLDHIIPISRGGSNEKENLQTFCSKCNNDKGNRMPNLLKKHFRWWCETNSHRHDNKSVVLWKLFFINIHNVKMAHHLNEQRITSLKRIVHKQKKR